MKKFVKIILAAGGIFSLLILLFSGYDFWIHGAFSDYPKRYYTAFVSEGKWKRYFAEISLPPDTKLIASGFEKGELGGGNSEELDYSYYWIVEGEQSGEELREYYNSYIEESSYKFGGYETWLEMRPFCVRTVLSGFPKFERQCEKIEEEIKEIDQMWVMIAIKSGRSGFIN